MITTQTYELFVNMITFFLAYMVVATVANVFRTWVAYKCGDDTPALFGFFTLNPLQHIDPIGLLCLFLFQFGWPRQVPINPLNIRYPYERLKLFAVYFADIAAYLLASIIGIVFLLMLFDPAILHVVARIALRDVTSHLYIANMYPNIPSFTVVVGYILVVFVYLNTLLAVLHSFVNSVHYLTVAYPERFEPLARRPFAMIALFLVLIYFFSPIVRLFVVWLIMSVGIVIAQLFGIG